MAEAAVDTSRFFCHKCRSEIASVLPGFKCPNCNSGFIEQLEQTSSDESSEEELHPILGEILQRIAQQGVAVSTEERRNARAPRISIRRTTNASSNAGRGRGVATVSLSDMSVPEFITNLARIAGLGLGSGLTTSQGFPVWLFSSGPDVEQHELDAIVTQLLNQMDGAGPPPLPAHLIPQIPTIPVSADLANKQCSVCFDYFKQGESVRMLACDHHYHEPCIIPWLELHGTCPICRKSLSELMGDPGCSN